MTILAVAGLSARTMAEAAVRDGFDVYALDLFGDIDTCAVARRWFGIGGVHPMQIDAERTVAVLRALARRGDVHGWVAGSGFEGTPDLLAQGAACLPLIGNTPDVVAKVRDPARFFGYLAQHDIPFPAVSWTQPPAAADWLVKDAQGCGGGHIRDAATVPAEGAPARHYFQRRAPGLSMSATFVANGDDAALLGVNQLIVRPSGERPLVYCGAVGPVPVADGVVQRVRAILRRLSAGFALRGLGSLDFMLDGDDVSVLEVNPRPSASIDLYGAWRPMAAHVQACVDGTLPSPAPPALRVEGSETVFARRPVVLDGELAQWLAAWPEAHDLPCAGQRFAIGDPVCTLGARGASVAEVLAHLQDGREALLRTLETCA